MNWLSAAERISAIDRKAVVYNPERCLHSMDKYVSCEACYQVCPVEAISPGKPPAFEQDACQTCLACLTVCLTGAYLAEDAVPALLKSAVRIEEETIELACEPHPKLESGPEEASVAVRVRGCLAGLGAGALLTLFAAGKKRVIVRLDACADCPWGQNQVRIMEQIDEARTLLARWDLSDQIETILTFDGMELQPRPVWDADNPPLSRRDLFRFASERSQLLAARALHPETSMQTARRPAADRLRMTAAVSQFPAEGNQVSGLPGMAVISVSDDCTACGACERACPTCAIDLELLEFKTFELKLHPAMCVGCGICQQLCAPDAITIDHQPSFDQVFGQTQTVVLQSGEIARCERCSVVMAKKPGKLHCPICEHRLANPFGGELPPRLMRLLKSQADAKRRQQP